MRFIHTADWHLGRRFHGESLDRFHTAFGDFLVSLARETKVDGILMAGDFYDRALPPSDAVALANDLLSRLASVSPTVVIPGNHDSATRLRFGSRLLKRGGLHMRTELADIKKPVMIKGVAVYAVPYLEPDLVRSELGCERGHGPAMEAAMSLVEWDLQTRAPERSIVMAHAFVAGAQETASERDLGVGGAASVSAAVFSSVDYAALGHLHRPQPVAFAGRYSGSPLAFSFSEADHEKSVTIVDLTEKKPVTEQIACRVGRPLARLRGTLDELLVDPRYEDLEGAWVQATLTDPARPADSMERLRRRFPHAMEIVFDPQGASAPAAGSISARIKGLDDRELMAMFVHEARGTEASDEETELLDEALTAKRVAEVSS